MPSNQDISPIPVSWERVAADKRAIRDAHIEKHQYALKLDAFDPETLDIDNVIALLQTGQISAHDLTCAYIAI
ncbi:hypothetical protein ACLX1H_003055 [Fusarium chlamydosporum]